MPSERRRQRLYSLIKEEIGKIVFEEEEWPSDIVVTVTRIELSDDMEHVNVSVSVLPEKSSQEVIEKLVQDAGEIQHILNRRLRMRPVPRIRFVPDETEAEAGRVESELYKLKKKKYTADE